MSEQILQYMPFSSFVNPSFWYKLTEIKLETDKLCDDSKSIWGFYSNLNSTPCNLDVDSTSFNLNFQFQNDILPAFGVLLNKNTIEQFKDEDKVRIINYYGAELWKDIVTGKVINKPALLVKFVILSFADLKKYKYYYWFGFPTPINLIVHSNNEPVEILSEFKKDQVSDLFNFYNSSLETFNKQFFVVKLDKNSGALNVLTLKMVIKHELDSEKAKLITNLNNCDLKYTYFAFTDPSNNKYPGWPLRNYLLFLLYYCPVLYGKSIKILSFRTGREKNSINCEKSLIFTISIPQFSSGLLDCVFPKDTLIHWSGWERNERGNFGPKMANMGATMDPIRLAENSVDLNLKLMKWRLLPDLDLNVLHKIKCLILGAGTLGCSVARCLLGWGVRNITFVDNAKISFSNPVRQSLYTHEDCLNGGKDKATAASESIKKIFPGVQSNGFILNIPMPGHSIGDSLLDETKKSVEILEKLFEEHDVIFLLMDSRESRWLPTLLGCHYKKIILNAALGFDTYLVMRHGYCTDTSEVESKGECSSTITGDKLGCYFCNDITAPGNSLKDRTLDQQCTVTRPGVSAIAAALVVELMVSILHHKDGPNARAYIKSDKDIASGDVFDNVADESLLGLVPHSIRGFLSSFSNVLPATPKFNQCIACSAIVLNEYRQRGFEFLLEVFNSGKILEDLTGLNKIQSETDFNEIWEISDTTDTE